MKPVLFVTGHVPQVRHAALVQLHQEEQLELALFGGRHTHGAPDAGAPREVPHRHVAQHELGALAAGDRYRAIIAGTGGRLALPTAWLGTRRAHTPFIFWAALWHQPRTPAHLAAYPLMRQIYRKAQAVVTYGPHVSAYVRAQGARNVHIAPQAVDNAFWREQVATRDPGAPLRVGSVGRAEHAKGLHVLEAAWTASGLAQSGATLGIVGAGHGASAAGVTSLGSYSPEQLRNFFATTDVLVIPSIPTPRFVEPWGLVANEAMNQATTIIASDAVGAAAGGLVRHERNGLIYAADDANALTGALRRLAEDRAYCRELGQNGSEDVRPYTAEAWARGFSEALGSIDLSRVPLVASR